MMPVPGIPRVIGLVYTLGSGGQLETRAVVDMTSSDGVGGLP